MFNAESSGTPLWPPERLNERYDYWQSKVVTATMACVHLVNEVAEDSQRTINALRAANAELERQLQEAQAWLPLPDGTYDSVIVQDDMLTIVFHDHLGPNRTDAWLDNNIRLCRLAKPASDGAAPVDEQQRPPAAHDGA